MKKPSHSLVARDLDLERAIQEFRGCCSRLSHGRVFLVVERDGSETVGHEVAIDRETSLDIDRIMRIPPRKQELKV